MDRDLICMYDTLTLKDQALVGTLIQSLILKDEANRQLLKELGKYKISEREKRNGK